MVESGHFPLLSWLLALPAAGALVVVPLRGERWPRRIALSAASLALIAAVATALAFDPARSGFQLVEARPWIAGLNIHYRVGIDGLSVLFLPATALLFLAAMVFSRRGLRPSPPLFYSLLLLFETATLGVFCALDTVLFFVCWELTLLPLFFLVSLWGGDPLCHTAARRYFFVMLAGGAPLLFAFVILAGGAPEAGLVFDLPRLLAANLPRGTQYAVFLLLLLGFGVKVPLVPLHTWLPPLALGAPAAVTALVVGLKLGAYGLIRFAIPLAPVAAQELHWLLAGLGTLALLYGAVTALAQTNLRAMLACSSISHVGLVVLALASFTVPALKGALLLLLSFALSTGGGFLLLAALQRRVGSTDLAHLGGAMKTMPLLAFFLLFFGLSGLGIPGTSGFPAEFLIVVAALQTHTGAGLAALFGMVVGAAAFLAPYRRAFFGPVTRQPVAEAEDLTPRERAMALVFALLVLGLGMLPSLALEVIGPTAEAWVAALAANR